MPLLLLDPARPPLAVLSEAPNPVHGEAGTVVGRPSAYGSYAWRLPPGSSAPVDRRLGDRMRLRLGPDLHAWVTAEDVRIDGPVDLGPAEAVPTAGVGSVEARRYTDRARIRVPVGRRLPAEVRTAGPRTLELTVHGGLGGTERMDYGPADELIRSLSWEQLPGSRWRLRIRLSRRVWGWDLRWEDVGEPPPAPAGEESNRPEPPDAPDVEEGPWADAAGAAGPTNAPAATDEEAEDETPAVPLPDPASRGVLALDVRRPPAPRQDEPLRGLRVAVDPGHPPVGAEGPTGLEEAEANLAVARRLARQLREAGAEPVLVRSGDGAVGLYERRRRARAAAAHVLVSIHNNALPDGLRPHGREGTSTYYYHDHARPLAAEIQRGMLVTMGLRDLGLHWGNLALPRESWMPSVLTEGAFMMIPRHEAALRTETFQAAYARGVVEGLRRFLREVAGDVEPGRK
jgi:N-acetylmuramoyl-L-alanine amidase